MKILILCQKYFLCTKIVVCVCVVCVLAIKNRHFLYSLIVFFVEEQSKAGQVSQPVKASEPWLGYLSKLTAPAYFLG